MEEVFSTRRPILQLGLANQHMPGSVVNEERYLLQNSHPAGEEGF